MKRKTKKDFEKQLLEPLAELEHKQWQSWAKIENPEHPLINVPYSKLTEEQKELDRIWARKIIDLIFKKLQES